MNSAPDFSVSRPRASRLVVLRARAFRTLPALLWFAAIGVIVLLMRDRTTVLPIKAIADTTRYAVNTPVDAALASLSVREQQAVERGQVLGHLHDESLRLRLASARLDLERLRAELHAEQVLMTGKGISERFDREADRGAALRRLYRDIEAAQLDGLTTRAEIEQSRVSLQGIGVELQRLLTLGEAIASGTELTRLRTEHDRLEKRITELQGVLAGHDDRVRAGRERLAGFQALERPAVDDDAVLEPFRFRIRAQEVELEQITLGLDQHRLVAPADGTVEEIRFRPGERMLAGQTVITIVEPRARAIIAYVPEPMRNLLEPSMPVQVARSDAPNLLRTTAIASISPALVLVPPRLWTDPRVEEWALAVYLEATGDELPGQRMFVRWR